MNSQATQYFISISQILEQICLIPYTGDELMAFGCLGYDIENSNEFAEIYLQELQNKQKAMPKNEKVAFADLNVQIYGDILASSAVKKIPEWITIPEYLTARSNPIKQKIINLYRKKLNLTQKKP